MTFVARGAGIGSGSATRFALGGGMGFWTGFGLGGGVAGALDGWDEGRGDADAADCSFARRFRRIYTALSEVSTSPNRRHTRSASSSGVLGLSDIARTMGAGRKDGEEQRRSTRWGTRRTCRQPGPAPAAFFSPTITMFFGRLLATAQACALPSRSFSTTACLGKMKTHQGAKKRWTSLPSGKFKRVRAYTCGSFAAN